MRLYSLLVLAIAELAAGEQILPKQAVNGVSARQLFAKAEPLFEYSKRASCDIGQVTCHDGCMSIGGQCCASTGWCKAGTVCDERLGGCCPIGKTCTNGPLGGPTCDAGYTPCKDKCMLIGGDCCNDGTFCKAGTQCNGIGGCSTGTGGGGNTNQCLSTQTLCNNKCMPLGSVCCGNGRYCPTGYSCVNAGLNCAPGGTGGTSGGNQCLSTQETCNNKCMPKGSICCGNGKYCPTGYSCVNAGLNCSPGGTGGGVDTSSPAPEATTYVLTSDGGSGASPTDTQAGFPPPADTTSPLATSTPNAGGVTAATNAPTQTKAAGDAGILRVPSAFGAVAMALALFL
jgi:hypothetical protein